MKNFCIIFLLCSSSMLSSSCARKEILFEGPIPLLSQDPRMKPEWLLGLNRQQIIGYFGIPNDEKTYPASKMSNYYSKICNLSLDFRPDSETGEFKVAQYYTLNLHENGAVSATTCIESLRRRE